MPPAEIRSYAGFTQADAAILARLRPVAIPHFDAIADEFYALIRAHEGAFSVLADEAQASRLRGSLKVWLGDLLAGPYGDASVERHARVGRVHARLGLSAQYIVVAMGRIRAFLQRVAADAFSDDPEAGRIAPHAVARACDVALAVMVEGYEDDCRDRVGRARAGRAGHGEVASAEAAPFGDALQLADVAILGFDASARIVIANRKAEDLTGYALDELVEGDFFARLFQERAAAVREQWLGATGGQAVVMEADLRTRTGKTRTLRWHAAARAATVQHEWERQGQQGQDVHDAGAPRQGTGPWVVVGIDVTNERELDRRARLNERIAASGALAAGLAHEIRNPLNGASLHLSVLDRTLARRPGVPPEALEATQVLRGEIRRLSALVTGYLEVARPRPLILVDADANEIVHSTIAALGKEAEAGGKVLAVEPCPLPARAKIDVDRITQAIVHLVRNGLEAIEPGGGVVVRVRRLAEHLAIDVADEGCGVQDASAPIFDAFYTTKDRGTGLGLSIVQRIVTDHGGDVRFESRPGATVFTVRIPASPWWGRDG